MASKVGVSGYKPEAGEVGEWQRPGELPIWRSIAILLLGAAILAMAYIDLSGPMNHRLAARNLLRGDAALVAENYDAAIAEYHTAFERNPSLQVAADRAVFAELAKTDPLQVRSLFEELGASVQITKLDRATRPFTNAPDALVTGVGLLQEGEKSYAQYALKKAVELDPNYIEAKDWLKKAE